MANNCNEACTSSCESTCKESCTQKCIGSCSNLCDSVCTYVCRNLCTSSCGSMCGDSCDESCISKCSGTEMSITNIETFYDRGYDRKVTKLTNSSNNGYLIYPGLNGKISIFKIVNNFIIDRLATAIYNSKIHGSSDESDNARSDAFSILEIQRVIYDALVRSIGDDTGHITLEDILYLVYRDPMMKRLCYDIQNWSWNNTDTYYYNLIKKPEDPNIYRHRDTD